MGTTLLLLFLVTLQLFTAPSTAAASPHISAIISQSGLDFAKDLLVSHAAATLTPLSVPDMEKTVNIPLVGTVVMVASGIVLDGLAVTDSTIAVGDTGVVVAASLASANLTMEWSYSCSAWFVTISDCGNASIQVEGMEVGASMGMKNQNGSLKLSVMECGCYMENLDITLNGGASWFYQVFVDSFSNHIRSSVENAITNKIMEGALKLDTFLGNLPKKVDLDKVAAMNVTFVNDPIFKSSSVEFDIDGLFVPSDENAVPRAFLVGDTKFSSPFTKFSSPPETSSKMLWISLDEDVFNSVSDLYFKAGLLQQMVDKIPDQFLLNTASWRFLVPRLYEKYPNDDMLLNISAISPPSVRITVGRIDAAVDLDVTVNVLDLGEIVPVACLSVSVAVSGAAAVSENNLVGKVELDYFSFTLRWSKVGKLHTILVQTVLRLFLRSLFVPYVNSYLKEGFQLPIIKGFSVRDAYILTSHSRMIVSCDVAFIGPEAPFLVQDQRKFIV
ncbi:hypothetical protein U9M48_014730 [Paspalum notatum var. saurae]|uniref:Lipid-binding serum glycoprotein C-terminal domain-containing protein n=1 Tax=Paspalum notatum var. saurae TaxID=547442 RepID=A0AAQ3WL62_PASNO